MFDVKSRLNELGYTSETGILYQKEYTKSIVQVIGLLDGFLDAYHVEIKHGVIIDEMMKDIQIALNRAKKDFETLREEIINDKQS